ncbi:12757_t:CDS:2 [Racocetra persica]|uniref:12757_t:CDS:1 n=1 Tax=Racocetra persica TaxID=160502 RepID=A0ACA9KK23_9GLOM|nr:12757_t:CDS:2 [Racocetra persica]
MTTLSLLKERLKTKRKASKTPRNKKERLTEEWCKFDEESSENDANLLETA